MRATSTAGAVHTGYGSSSGAIPVLAYEHRHGPLRFEKGDGHVVEAYPINYDELLNLKGRLLTLADATFTDPEQRKAHKDLIWQALKAWMQTTVEAGRGTTVEGGTS
jgi:hypothetical protein